MYQVEGFTFESKEVAEQAKREAEGIRYIRQQTPMGDPGVVLKLYNRLLEQGIFETSIGIGFLCELQEYLYESPEVSNEYVLPIPIKEAEIPESQETVSSKTDTPKEESQEKEASEDAESSKKGKSSQKEKQQLSENGKNYKRAFHVSLFFAIVFFLVIVGMFAITYISGKSTNILNFENEIIDKYEAWEIELKEREDTLRVREAEFERREALFEERMKN